MEKEGLRHIIETQQFKKEWLEKDFFGEAEWMEKMNEKDPMLLKEFLRDKNIVLLFWEPSSRTRSSFYSAALRLGAGVEVVQGSKKEGDDYHLEFSSEIKGEIFEDSIRTFASYYDLIVIRHPEEGFVGKAVKILEEFDYGVAVINAGDGPGQHPTQALLDLYTIKKEFGRIDGLSVAFLGDLFYSRVIHSLVYLLAKFDTMMYFVSPPHLKMPPDIINHLIKHGSGFKEIDISRHEKIKADIWYVVRVQKERFRKEEDYLDAKGSYVVDKGFIERLKIGKKSRVFHPFPRADEIPAWQINDLDAQKRSIDKLPQAAYFRQVKNGLFVRMALLKMLLAPDKKMGDLAEQLIRPIAQCVVCGRLQCSEIGWAERKTAKDLAVAKVVCPSCRPKIANA